jgi:hypothetical protein
MSDARLEVTDALGRRIVPISKNQFEIGRRAAQRPFVQLLLAAGEVAVDQRPGDARLPGHIVEGDVLGRVMREEALRGRDQLAAALRHAQPAVRRSGRCWAAAHSREG